MVNQLASLETIKNYMLKYPGLNIISKYNKEQIFRLFKQSGYLSLKQGTELENNFQYYLDFLSRTEDNAEISINLVHEENDVLLSGCGILKIYDNTYLAHHLAAVPEARFNVGAKINLYLAGYEIGYLDQSIKYHLAYYDAHSSWHKKLYTDFKVYIDNEKLCNILGVEFFECTINPGEALESDFKCELTDDYDEFMEYCQEKLTELECGCYMFSSDGFSLDNVKKLYSNYGYAVERALYKVHSYNNTHIYAIAESFPQGSNLYNLMDTCHIYFTEPVIENRIEMAEKALNALLQKVNQFYKSRNKSQYNVFLNAQGDHIRKIKATGLEYSHTISKFLIDKKCFPVLAEFLRNKTDKLMLRASRRTKSCGGTGK